MKTNILFLLVLGVIQAHSAPFQNLGFDAADTTNVSGVANSAPTSEMLPGWVLRTRDRPTPRVSYNFFPIGGDIASIYDRPFADSLPFPVEGIYSLGLFPEPILVGPFSLSQVGDVPADARSIHFLNFGGQFEIRVNDILVPLVYVYPPDYHTDHAGQFIDVFGDIASFAGQTVDLKFTTIQRTIPPFVNGIDGISFSPELIPEPSTWALLALGGIGLFFKWGVRRGGVQKISGPSV